MKTIHRDIMTLSFLLTLALASAPPLLAQSPGSAIRAEAEASTANAPASSAGAELNWPRIHTNNSVTIAIYQPQIEKWEGEDLESRSAVAITPAGANAPLYGVFWMRARAEVDKAGGIVTLNDIQVTRAKFPTSPAMEAEYLTLIRSHVPSVVQNMALDHLEASYAISEAVRKARAVPVKNDPPRVIYTTSPALLVLVDGPPVLRPMLAVPGVQQVLNSPALIVQTAGVYYLFASDHWYQANAIEGPWALAPNVPASLEAAKQAAVAANTVDLMPPGENAATKTPAIYVSTTPAELVQSDGAANLVPIEGTDLMEVKNSDSAVFLCLADQNYYVLISGRWFKARTLEGPWTFAPYKKLPPDLARIPANHPRANVLVSVPGTPQAEEAVIANSIPQTASVKRNEATLQVAYDGPPQFRPIESTPLAYAVNSPTPVIQVDAKTYYSVQNGVWFVATLPEGPWTVASSVPAVIYSIPASCPIHYVTYVRVYGATPEYVYVGYTPGYFGTVVCPDYVVVYGSGWYYRPYIGTRWIGWPCTYGFGAGFAVGWDIGFGFGFAAGFPGWCHPWWGPYGWGWRHGYHYMHVSINHVSAYNHWGRNVVRPSHPYGFNSWQGRGWSRSWPSHFNPYASRAPLREVPGQYHAYHGNFQARPEAPRPAAPPVPRVAPPRQPMTRPRQPVTPPSQPAAPPRQPVAPHPAQVIPRQENIPHAPVVPPRNNVFGDNRGNVYRYNPPAQSWERNRGNQWQRLPANRGTELNRDAYGRNLGQQRFDAQRSYGGGYSRSGGRGDRR